MPTFIETKSVARHKRISSTLIKSVNDMSDLMAFITNISRIYFWTEGSSNLFESMFGHNISCPGLKTVKDDRLVSTSINTNVFIPIGIIAPQIQFKNADLQNNSEKTYHFGNGNWCPPIPHKITTYYLFFGIFV